MSIAQKRRGAIWSSQPFAPLPRSSWKSKRVDFDLYVHSQDRNSDNVRGTDHLRHGIDGKRP